MDQMLHDRLAALAAQDEAVRARLAADGSLFDGYHSEMQAVHEDNAAELEAIVAERGWPSVALVGEKGAEAAWLIAQHAIGLPDFQRRCLASMQTAAEAGAIPAWQPAYLLDRIRIFEGRTQIYGTQFDWNEDGLMSPRPIDVPGEVDARRAAVGLGPLAEATARHRLAVAAEPRRPGDPAKRRREMHAWAIRVGWRGP